jgi:hypothetical protein
MTDKEASPERSEPPGEATPKPGEQPGPRGMRTYSLATGFVGVFGIVLFLTAALDVLDGNYAAATAFAVMACYAHLVSTWPYRSF